MSHKVRTSCSRLSEGMRPECTPDLSLLILISSSCIMMIGSRWLHYWLHSPRYYVDDQNSNSKISHKIERKSLSIRKRQKLYWTHRWTGTKHRKLLLFKSWLVDEKMPECFWNSSRERACSRLWERSPGQSMAGKQWPFALYESTNESAEPGSVTTRFVNANRHDCLDWLSVLFGL